MGVFTVFFLLRVCYFQIEIPHQITIKTITMSACSFNQAFTGTADALVANLKTQVQNNGGTFTGDSSSGSFSVSVVGSDVSGTYTIAGQQLNVEIDKKPFFASCSAIEKFLSSHLS
jgi:hypothetical protein